MKLYDWFEWRLRWFSHRISYLSGGSPDYSVKEGDWVTVPDWKGPIKVVSINWAISSAAFKLGKEGGIVCWPIDGMKPYEGDI